MVGLTARLGRTWMGDASTASDARLLQRALTGDRGAFDDLVRRHFAEVYGLIHRLVGNHEDAEDLAVNMPTDLGTCFLRFVLCQGRQLLTF